MPAIRNDTENASMLAPTNVRERKKRNGTIGYSVRDSTQTKTPNSTADMAKAPRISELSQPRLPASIKPQVSDAMAAVTSSVPGMSVASSPDVSRDSRT